MSEKEKGIMTRLSDTVLNLREKDQSYILGLAEGMAIVRDLPENKEAQSLTKTQQTA